MIWGYDPRGATWIMYLTKRPDRGHEVASVVRTRRLNYMGQHGVPIDVTIKSSVTLASGLPTTGRAGHGCEGQLWGKVLWVY